MLLLKGERREVYLGLILGVKEKNRILETFPRYVFLMEFPHKLKLLTDIVVFVWEFVDNSVFC